MNCRIIALKVLDDCSGRWLRILKPGTTYLFLQDFQIHPTGIVHQPGIPDNFFSGGQTSIQLSAIVGKNGSGKSTLIELLVMAINNIAHFSAIRTDVELERIEGLSVELYLECGDYYKIRVNEKMSVFRQRRQSKVFRKVTAKQFKINELCYTILVNYALYGLNSTEIGNWIDSMFHKNDGYQVPLVIIPMRKQGIIDVNSEKALAKARLIANILAVPAIDGSRNLPITASLVAKRIQLKLRQPDDKPIYTNVEVVKKENGGGSESVRTDRHEVRLNDLKSDLDEVLKIVNDVSRFGYKGRWETGNHVVDAAHRYLITKLVKIAITYPVYNRYFEKSSATFDMKRLPEFIRLLMEKNANHISFKFKQTLNFLKYRHITVADHRGFALDIDEFAGKLTQLRKKYKLSQEALIELIPPPILTPDISMFHTTSKKDVSFESLSSGEKQSIFSVHSILYHLINLDSVKSNRWQKGYRCVSIVMEEIELYFHPELQREFVKILLNMLQSVSFKRIRSINCCLVTHSPFILSDIPGSNILYLKEDGLPYAYHQDTFGANIYDLLRDSFFLGNYMGDVARKKINQTIDYLEYRRLQQQLDGLTKDNPLYAIRRQELELLEAKKLNMDRDDHLRLINVIGEPILKKKLSDTFDELHRQKSKHS